MDGGPGETRNTLNLTNVNLKWSVRDSKDFGLKCEELCAFVLPAVRASAASVVEETPFHWRGSLSHALSLFDRCEVVVSITPLEERAASTVDVEVSFEPTENRVIAVAFLGMSIVGIPLVLAWRARSLTRARAFSEEVLGAIWGGISERAGTGAYR